MNTSDCYTLGYITKTFGYKGELVLFLDVDDPNYYQGLDAVFVETKGQLIPYFIETIRINGQQAVARFEEVNANDAEKLVGSALFLPLKALPPLSGNKFYYHEIVTFKAYDAQHGYLGVIETVIDNGPQAILQVKHDSGNEILVPLIDAFIVRLDRNEKQLHLQCPEGLVEFYLN